MINAPKCSCGSPYEDAFHFCIKCPLYCNQRVTLFTDLCGTDRNIEILRFGNDDYSDKTNSIIFEKVRLSIKQKTILGSMPVILTILFTWLILFRNFPVFYI